MPGSAGYSIIRGSFCRFPRITAAERLFSRAEVTELLRTNTIRIKIHKYSGTDHCGILIRYDKHIIPCGTAVYGIPLVINADTVRTENKLLRIITLRQRIGVFQKEDPPPDAFHIFVNGTCQLRHSLLLGHSKDFSQ